MHRRGHAASQRFCRTRNALTGIFFRPNADTEPAGIRLWGGVGGRKMKVELDRQRSLITVWIDGGEEPQALQALCQRCQGTPYQVAVFRSGSGDLLECTTGLLLHNRELV